MAAGYIISTWDTGDDWLVIWGFENPAQTQATRLAPGHGLVPWVGGIGKFNSNFSGGGLVDVSVRPAQAILVKARNMRLSFAMRAADINISSTINGPFFFTADDDTPADLGDVIGTQVTTGGIMAPGTGSGGGDKGSVDISGANKNRWLIYNWTLQARPGRTPLVRCLVEAEVGDQIRPMGLLRWTGGSTAIDRWGLAKIGFKQMDKVTESFTLYLDEYRGQTNDEDNVGDHLVGVRGRRGPWLTTPL